MTRLDQEGNNDDMDGISTCNPIALVTGVAFRIPGASNLKELSSLLQSKHPTAIPGRLNQFGTIDADFFKMSQTEACQSSPVLGTLLEVVAECIMESGIPLRDVTSRRIGLYIQSNVCDAYTELTCNVAHYFNIKGPVVNFSALNECPSNAVMTALLDMMAGRCELAIVAGVSKQSHCMPTTEKHPEGQERFLHDPVTEGVVAMLIMAPNLKSKLMSRIHCEITSFEFLNEKDIPVHDFTASRLNHLDTNSELLEIFHLFDGELKDKNERNMTKFVCSDVIQNIFKGAHSISALIGIITVPCTWYCMFNKSLHQNISTSNQSEGDVESNPDGQELLIGRFGMVVCGDMTGAKFQVVLKRSSMVAFNKTMDPNALLVPITVHAMVNMDEAQKALGLYENDPGFLPFLVNSDFCKGSNGPLQQLQYYFKIPDGSHFSKQDYTAYCEMPVTIVFDDFLLSPWKPALDFLNHPIIEKSIFKFDETLKSAGSSFSVLGTLKPGDVRATNEEGGIATRIACQMAVVDLLIASNSLYELNTIRASGMGSVAALYADGALTRTQAVRVAVALEDALLKAENRHDDNLFLDVFCPIDEVYQLGPWVQILCRLPMSGFRVASPSEKREQLLQSILEKGFEYRELPIRIPVFSLTFRKYLDDLDKRLDTIILTRSMWSSKVEILGFTSKQQKVEGCSASFFVELLCTPFDGDTQTLQTFGLSINSRTTELGPLNTKETCKIGVTTDEQNATDMEICMINLATNDVFDHEMSAAKSRNKQLDSKNVIEPKSAGSFEKYKPGIRKLDILLRNLQQKNTSEQENVFSMPSREPDGSEIDCSTNAVKGSCLSSLSIRTDCLSSSSVSELQSQDTMSDCLRSQMTHNNASILRERMPSEELPEGRKQSKSLHLHFFSGGYQGCLVDSYCRSGLKESSSASSQIDGEFHMHIDPNQIGLLDSLAWIHCTGNRMDAERQLSDTTSDTRYHGDFGIDNIWAWNRHPCCRIHSGVNPYFDCKEHVTIYSLTPKLRLNEDIIQTLITTRTLEHPSQDTSVKQSVSTYESHVCCFDACLLSLSGYKWDPCIQRVVSTHSSDYFVDDLKMQQKQVRFSYRSNSGHSNDGQSSMTENGDCLSSVTSENKVAISEEFDYCFSDPGELLEVLSRIQSDDYKFVSLLQMDGFLEKYLMDMLYTFPLTSSLHVFITPKLNGTSSSKYVLNISRNAYKYTSVGSEVCVLLRDRSTDQTEKCLSVTKALSIVSSFEDGIYKKCLARVFEFPMFFDDASFSVKRLEFMIFEHETELSKEAYSNYDKENGTISSTYSTTSSSYEIEEIEDLANAFDDDGVIDCNGNVASKCSIAENVSSSDSYQERASKESGSTLSTNFYLNLDETFVQTLSKLTTINEHTIAVVQPKIQSGFSDNESDFSDMMDLLEISQHLKPPFPENNEEIHQQNKSHKDCAIRKQSYMLSIRPMTESQIFLYCKNPQEISRWNSIADAVEELHKRNPDVHNTHEVYVSKCDEKEISFEELLYAFMYDSDYVAKGPNKENEKGNRNGCHDMLLNGQLKRNLDVNGDQLYKNCSHYDNDDQKTNALQTTTPFLYCGGFVIPDIVITPPNQIGMETIHANARCKTFVQLKNSSTTNVSDCLTNKESKTEDRLGIENKSHYQLKTSIECMEKPITYNIEMMNHEVLNSNGTSQTCLEDPIHLSVGSIEASTLQHEFIKREETLTPQNILKTMELNKDNLTQETLTTHPEPVSINKSAEELVKANIHIQVSTSSSRPENDSDKENTALYIEPDITNDLEHLKKPKFEGFDDMKCRVSSSLVVHLTDKTSSFHEQKGRAAGNVLLYIAKEIDSQGNDEKKTFLGIVFFDDMDARQTRINIPSNFQDSHLETALNYYLAWYILRILARINKDKATQINTLVQSPIQRDSAAIMVVASQLGCKKIVTSSTLEEAREDIHRMVARSVVLDRPMDPMAVTPLVGGAGVDVAVMLRQQELNEMLEMLAPSGCLVLCGEVDRTKEINVNSLAQNGQMTFFDALSAIRYLTTMEEQEKAALQENLFYLMSNHDLELLDECYPPSKEGYFYQVLGRFSTFKPNDQPMESFLLKMFFSTTQPLQSALLPIVPTQRKVLEEIYRLMSKCPGEECVLGGI